MIKLLLVAILMVLIPANSSNGQFYATGEPPSSITFKSIRTEHFNIVFPAAITGDANRLANLLEYYYPLTMGDLARPMKTRFPVLLHSTSVISNGYVALAPKRMELVPTTPQDAYAENWLSQLALHEFRHAVQLNRLNQGFTRAMTLFTGEISRGVFSSLVPSWFYEGDAVYNETVLSQSGRGRLAGFEMPLRPLLLEKSGSFSYDKSLFGSYRDFVPDQYLYGYQMVKYARTHYGSKVWANTLDYAARYPFFLWPVDFYLKRHYGVNNAGLYYNTMDSLKTLYSKQINDGTYSKYLNINIREKSDFANYLLPQDVGRGRVLVLKTGLDEPSSLVIIDSLGNENLILRTGITMKLACDVSGNKIIWDEVERDPRWERRDYSVIKIFDLQSGKKHALSRRTRYFSPVFSPDASRIAVVEIDKNNRNYLTILGAVRGEQIRQIPLGDFVAQSPAWISMNEIVVVTVSSRGKQLETVNIENENRSVQIPYTRYDIAEPINYNGYILFRASFHGTENIYAVKKDQTKTISQVTFTRYGAFHPSVSLDLKELFFSSYGLHGFDVSRLTMDTLSWIATQPLIAQNSSVQDSQSTPGINVTPAVTYPVSNYRKGLHLLHVHSWLPFYTDIDEIRNDPTMVMIYPGVMLFSQNLLNTFISSYSYNYSNGYHFFRPTLTWRGWYPVIELSGQLGGPQVALGLPEGIHVPSDASPYTKINLRTYIPLYFSKGSFLTFMQPMIEFERASVWYYTNGQLKNGFDFLHLRYNVTHYRRMGWRDLYPRWGQSIFASYSQTLQAEGQFGNLFSFSGTAFIPGILPHHHFFIKGGFQVQHPEKYYLPINRIDFPRGYTATVSKQFAGLALNYSFPVAYPDLAFPSILYVKRIRANLFYDLSYGIDIRELNSGGHSSYTGYYRSGGMELLVDMHLLRIIFPISSGFRMGYLPATNKLFTEFIMNIDTGIF